MPEHISSHGLSALIGSIYDCALDPDHWDQTLSDLRDVFGGHNAGLTLIDRRHGRILVAKDVGLDRQQLEERARHVPEVIAHMSSFVRQHSLDEPHVFSRHLSAGERESVPYFQLMRDEGFIDVITCFLIWTPDHVSGFGVARLERQGVFTSREIMLGGLVLPHLRRAVTISKVLDARAIERQRMAEALDVLKCGVVLTSQSGAILHANGTAERMMRQGDAIQAVHGVLQAKAPAAAKELRCAIRLAAKDETELGKTGLAIRLNEDDALTQFAHVLPLGGGKLRAQLAPGAVAAVFVGSAHDEKEGAEAMAAAFGLTFAEKRLLESLLAGRSLVETAAASGSRQRPPRPTWKTSSIRQGSTDRPSSCAWRRAPSPRQAARGERR